MGVSWSKKLSVCGTPLFTSVHVYCSCGASQGSCRCMGIIVSKVTVAA